MKNQPLRLAAGGLLLASATMAILEARTIPQQNTRDEIPGPAQDAEGPTRDDRVSGFGRLRRAQGVSIISEHEVSELGGSSNAQGATRMPIIELFPAKVEVPLGVPYTIDVHLINNDEIPVVFLKPRLSCGCVSVSEVAGELPPYETRKVSLTLAAVKARKSERVLFPVQLGSSTWELELRIDRRRR